MDPDATLTELRRLCAARLDSDYEAADRAREITHLFAALDAWIVQGGFLPTAWQR